MLYKTPRASPPSPATLSWEGGGHLPLCIWASTWASGPSRRQHSAASVFRLGNMHYLEPEFQKHGDDPCKHSGNVFLSKGPASLCSGGISGCRWSFLSPLSLFFFLWCQINLNFVWRVVNI